MLILSAKHIVLLSLGLFAVLALIIAVIASEMLEPPSNKETTYITLVFNSDGDVEGIRGITGINPSLTARSSNVHQLATVKNLDDDNRHQLVIDKVAMSRVLGYGDEDTVYISGLPEGSYRYTDGLSNRTLGELKVVKVTAYG